MTSVLSCDNSRDNATPSSFFNASRARAHRIYQRRQVLYSAGSAFKGIYQLRSGSAKATFFSADGHDLITAFYFPGDNIGFDGFNNNRHSQTISFLETSSAVFISQSEIALQLQNSSEFRTQLIQTMSRSIFCEQQILMRLAHCSSEQRVAYFLIHVGQRFSERGLSADHFSLSMTRTDIASFLGMAIETLCRALSLFQQLKLIDLRNREITILDLEGLQVNDHKRPQSNCGY